MWISSKINKKLKNNNNFQQNNTQLNIINQKLALKNPQDTFIDEKTSLEYENYGTYSLQKDQILTLSFSGVSQIEIIPQNNSILLLESNLWNQLISASESIPGINGAISIKNLSGIANFTLTSDTLYTQEEYNYKIIEKVGNKNIIKQTWTLK